MLHTRIVWSSILLLFCVGTLRAETKEEKMQNDQTQQHYTRKSITYIGPVLDRGVIVPDDHLALIEKGIRAKTELKRFDYNQINLGSIFTIDQFVNVLREYVKKRSSDRAGADAEYEARFKSARVYLKDIDRIMNSAYFYNIKVYAFHVGMGKCPDSKATALLMGCLPGTPGIVSKLSATTTFYRANLTDESKPPYQLIKEVKHGVPVVGFKELIPTNFKPEQLAQLVKQKSIEATQEAAATLAEFLSKGMKQIPDFQLKTPVSGVLSDGVEFMLGKGEGVGLDDTYEVTEFGMAGDKKLIGYVKVRDIGDSKGSGEGTPSYAEQVKVKSKFAGGEQLFEHAMIGLSIGIHGVFELMTTDIVTNDGMGFFPGVGIYIDKDLANLVGWPEFYVSVEADAIFLGSDDYDNSWMLIHAMLGVKKKWYMNSLVFSVGLRGGISYFKIDNYEDNAIGGGADAVFGLEYYFLPEFSIYLNAAGRFFTNPLSSIFPGADVDPEMGAQLNVGAFLAF
ncbi:MAG TPA: hypothetical protein VM425_11240 [Myxococcota bacterium]|nr:hypothetical protein [Myxococcota bacterium]